MTVEADVATRAAARATTVKAVVQPNDREATRAEMRDVVTQLIESLEIERTMRKSLLARMRAEVERGDRMLAELGIARPSPAE